MLDSMGAPDPSSVLLSAESSEYGQPGLQFKPPGDRTATVRPTNVPPDYIDYETAAAKLGISLASFRDRYGKSFGGIKVGNRRWIPIAAIEAEIIRRANTPNDRRFARVLNRKAEEAKAGVLAPVVEGRPAADAFKLFREGKTMVDVVIDLALPTEVVEHLWSQYTKFSKSFLLDTKSVTKLRAVLPDWTEPVATGAGLYAAIVRLQVRAAHAGEGEITITPEEAARIEREAAEDEAASEPVRRIAGGGATPTVIGSGGASDVGGVATSLEEAACRAFVTGASSTGGTK